MFRTLGIWRTRIRVEELQGDVIMCKWNTVTRDTCAWTQCVPLISLPDHHLLSQMKRKYKQDVVLSDRKSYPLSSAPWPQALDHLCSPLALTNPNPQVLSVLSLSNPPPPPTPP